MYFTFGEMPRSAVRVTGIRALTSSDAEVTVLVCKGSSLGASNRLPPGCRRGRSAVGARIERNSGMQLVTRVVPQTSKAGKIAGFEVTYRQGLRFGRDVAGIVTRWSSARPPSDQHSRGRRR